MSLGEADMFFPSNHHSVRMCSHEFGEELFLATLFNASTPVVLMDCYLLTICVLSERKLVSN